MKNPRPGYTGKLIELPSEVWAAVEELKASSGAPLGLLVEDAVRRYLAKPPAVLPAPQKRGPKPKSPPAETAESPVAPRRKAKGK